MNQPPGNPDLEERVRQGHYARKQLGCRCGLIARSHSQRLASALKAAAAGPGQRVLDYGSGDGAFLAHLASSAQPPLELVGAELDTAIVQDCAQRFTGMDGLSFLRIAELEDSRWTGHFDQVYCMEVLEHVADLEGILKTLARVLKPGGRLLVSVPVETGPVLMVKQCFRQLAAWRGMGDYPGPAPYRCAEFIRSLLAFGDSQHIQRPLHTLANGMQAHCHKGFNWRRLRQQLK